MPREWYIKSRSGHQGPISSRALKRLARKGKLTPNTGISQDAIHWVKAKRIPGLLTNPPTAEDASTNRNRTQDSKKRWYIRTNSGVVGPLSLSRLNKLAAKGRLLPNVAVSYDQQRWVKARRVRGLEFPTEPRSEHSTERAKAADQSSEIIRLPVVDELPIAGPLPTIDQLPSRLPVALPVIADLPIAGPIPRLSDLPSRVVPRVLVSLPVVSELPIAGPLPTIGQLPTRLPVALPVLHELPIPGPLPQLGDLPARQVPRTVVPLPVVDEVPIFGPLPAITLPARRTSPLAETRESAFAGHFGPPSQIIRPSEPGGISVCVYPANDRRPFATMVTSGLSDHAMQVPQGPWSPRAELIWYIDQPHVGYAESLRSLATIPSVHGRGFWFGATMDNGAPPAPIFRGSVLNSFLFMVSSVRADHALCDSLSIEGDPLQLLWVVPITLSERHFLNTYGMQQFCWLLDHNQHAICNDPGRGCFASGFNMAM